MEAVLLALVLYVLSLAETFLEEKYEKMEEQEDKKKSELGEKEEPRAQWKPMISLVVRMEEELDHRL